jgi:hypothetical protein
MNPRLFLGPLGGIINIVILTAHETRGTFAEAGAGADVQGFVSARYEPTAGPKRAWRVFGRRMDVNSTLLVNGDDAEDLETRHTFELPQQEVPRSICARVASRL